MEGTNPITDVVGGAMFGRTWPWRLWRPPPQRGVSGPDKECEEYRMERAAMKNLLKNIPLGLNVLFCTSKGHEPLLGFCKKLTFARWDCRMKKEGIIRHFDLI